ncbi:MAG: cytochrome C [Deltaproteobacteria bacterium]|nr:cytochrome C [Deltaproteobacteria bacterium]
MRFLLAVVSFSLVCGGVLVPRGATAQRLAPVPKGAASTHAPYGSGECGMCHKNNDPKNPGPALKTGSEMCFGCHDELKTALKRRKVHSPTKQDCGKCHNPHNSTHPKLLVDDPGALCGTCHKAITRKATTSKVGHAPMTQGKKCLTCHNAHASGIDHLLIRLPFDLCVECHSKDGMKSKDGKKLTNFKKHLDENKEWHAPVAGKDCSACHTPHGGDKFRLLTAEYPPEFYSPYEPKNYKLCFDCHNPEILASPRTRTLTRFRDGDRNLHYLHVNKADRGRTCRACHEVHASRQPNHIRDGVPYGPKGWILKVVYKKTPTGGTCEKTCHAGAPYNNGGGGKARGATKAAAAPKPAAAPKGK